MHEQVRSALKVAVPESILTQVLDHHQELSVALLARDWEKCLVRGGKLAESIMRFVHYLRTGKVVNRISVQTEIEEAQKSASLGSSAVRVMIPRHARVLYDHRSKRGGAHSSFDPNEMDSLVSASIADWLVAELLRLYGQTPPREAIALVKGLTRKRVPYVDEIDGDLVVLPATSAREGIGLILYKRYPDRTPRADLGRWMTGASSNAVAVAIHRLNKAREIHVNDEGIVLTSRGLAAVEEQMRAGEPS